MVSQALSTLTPSLHSPTHLPSLLAALLSELGPLPSRISTYVSGLPLIPPITPSSHQDIPSIWHIENCLKLIDHYLLNRWGDIPSDLPFDIRDPPSPQLKELCEALVSTCVASDIILRDPEIKEHHEACKYQLQC